MVEPVKKIYISDEAEEEFLKRLAELFPDAELVVKTNYFVNSEDCIFER